jgi:hypothetical protein
MIYRVGDLIAWNSVCPRCRVEGVQIFDLAEGLATFYEVDGLGSQFGAGHAGPHLCPELAGSRRLERERDAAAANRLLDDVLGRR